MDSSTAKVKFHSDRLLADDNRVVREEFRKLLELEDDIEVVGEAINGLQALDLARNLRPALVLMDVTMPGTDRKSVV